MNEETKKKVKENKLFEEMWKKSQLKVDIAGLVKKGKNKREILEAIRSSALWKCVEIEKELDKEEEKNGSL